MTCKIVRLATGYAPEHRYFVSFVYYPGGVNARFGNEIMIYSKRIFDKEDLTALQEKLAEIYKTDYVTILSFQFLQN